MPPIPLTVNVLPLLTIRPHPRNTRAHDETNLQAIMKSLQTFGQRTPIVIGRSKFILKGCGTWEAARRLGWATIQTVTADGLTPQQELAYSIADNKTSDLSDFKFEALADVLKYLESTKFDLDATGFAGYEREPLMQAEWSPGSSGELPTNTRETTAIQFEAEHMATIDDAVLLAKELGLVDPRARYPDSLVALCAKFLNEMELHEALRGKFTAIAEEAAERGARGALAAVKKQPPPRRAQ